METATSGVYPNCPAVFRTVDAGGMNRAELLQELQRNSVLTNEYAEQLFRDERFATSAVRYSATSVELAVANLGFPQGAVIAEVFGRAEELGLALCPLELAPALRLQYLNQPEVDPGHLDRANQAPVGSISVASLPLSEDDEFPKGFYLRHYDGRLWLRGYCCDLEHIWQADERVIFCRDPLSPTIAPGELVCPVRRTGADSRQMNCSRPRNS